MPVVANMNARPAKLVFGAMLITCSLAWTFVSAPANFVDITTRSRVDFRLENSPTPEKFLPETMGGGVAVLDYDNDGQLDILFVNGARLSATMGPNDSPDKSDPRFWNRLFHQNRDGSFTDATESAGLSGKDQNRYGMGLAVGDYDNDGREDIFVTGV